VAVPFPTLTPTPTPWPSATPPPVLDASRVAERFARAYADAWVAAQLRRPREEAVAVHAAFQAFEHGRMIWRADTDEIYVLYADGSRSNYNNTWDESQPVDDPARVPPAGLYQPVRGFGKLWRTEAGLGEKMGWALAPEQGYEMWVQWFEGGTMLLGPQGEIYALFPFWTWERR
jgi:alkanesulfonate monooxygenase SsuD/methylene tetrahydromethanopterin reductase-like flavin-dependent oxidoreductase (luciferase family)